MDKTDIKSLNYDELKQELLALGEKSYRADQIYEWLHQKLAGSFEEMTNLPLATREKLSDRFTITRLENVKTQVSREDGTRKYLFRLADGNVVESVRMLYHHGVSVCISSQVGCAMGCKFCASTIGGLVRNLLPSEMLDQIYEIRRLTGERVSNVVVMGTGEPLNNYDNLVKFIRILCDARGQDMSQRNITVSTCGIAPNMRKLARENLSVTLALSLHASNQLKREELMPIARTYNLAEVLEACDDYFRETGRRITYEYALVAGVNDGAEDARELIHLLGKKNCHINLIPVNPIRERSFRRPDRTSANAFMRKLVEGGINATIRREMGQDIDGACGQLRRHYEEG